MHDGRPATLVVNADDFGMCRSVNAGIVAGFRDGIITQASLMAPAPAFPECVALALAHAIPTGVHLTLASEWDVVRWASLTGAPGLDASDGCLPLHPRSLMGTVSREIIVREMYAQVEAILKTGLSPLHLDHHVAMTDDTASIVCTKFGLLCRDYMPSYPELCQEFRSVLNLSVIPAKAKQEALVSYIKTITDGCHLVICHPAQSGDDLEQLCSPALVTRRPWAVEYRISDLDAVTSPRVRRAVEEANVQLGTSQSVGSAANSSESA